MTRKPTKAYICHPLGGDVSGNLARIDEIVQFFAKFEIERVPIIPHYYAHSLDDNYDAQRRIALQWGLDLLADCDELHIMLGDIPIDTLVMREPYLVDAPIIDHDDTKELAMRCSPGMLGEIAFAQAHDIPVFVWVLREKGIIHNEHVDR